LKHYDQVLIAKEDYGAFQTLDYIFDISPLGTGEESDNSINSEVVTKKEVNNSQVNKLIVDYSSSVVEYFLVSNKPYQQLSDHFGLSVELFYS
jgi:hypothetical protein